MSAGGALPEHERLERDPRVVLTLDAGGTHLVFAAVRGAREMGPPITMAAAADDRAASLSALVDGFQRLREQAGTPDAISFAFPGPANYPAGIVGGAHNLPAFAGGVALGPMLQDHFGVPVFINNDGGLFAYGEALAGFLPWVNRLLAEAGSPRRCRSLFGATLGTGFGGGIICDGRPYVGVNGAAGEVWAMRHKLEGAHCVEDGVSIRAVRQEYARRAAGDAQPPLDPREIFEIAEGRRPGDRAAAAEAFRRLGEVAGDALADVMTLLDAPIVLGGGLSAAASLFLPALVAEMNGRLRCAGREVPRTDLTAFNLEDPADRRRFLACDAREVEVPGSGRKVRDEASRRIAVGLSRLGTSRATALGAYAVAVQALDKA